MCLMLYVGAVNKFDKEMVEAFKASVTMYPNGLSVELSDGRVGVVVKQNQYLNERPIIRILKENNEELMSPYDVNLPKEANILITACFV